MQVYAMCVQRLQRTEECVDLLELELGVVVSCCGHECGQLNSGPLEEQQVLLATEPSLQPRLSFSFCGGLNKFGKGVSQLEGVALLE